MFRTHYLLFVIILTLQVFPSWGQFYDVTRYADDSGLSSRIVRDVIQDRDGFIWVAGNNGLFKFDGQKFISFYADLKDTLGLRDNRIHALYETSDGIIWIGTPKGLHKMVDERISYVSLSDTISEGNEFVTSILEDKQGDLWVGTYAGLYLFPSDSEEIILKSGGIEGAIQGQGPGGMELDKEGNLWVTNDSGIHRGKVGSRAFESIPIHWKGDLTSENTNLFRILHQDGGFFLVESSRGMLKGIWNGSSFSIEQFIDSNGTPVADDFIYYAIIDRHGDLWTATWSNYVRKYRIEGEDLIPVEIVTRNGWRNMASHAISVREDQQGNMWVANANGLYKFSEDGGKLFVFPPSNGSSCFDDTFSVMSMVEDGGGNVWITTVKGLYRIPRANILNRSCPEAYLFYDDPRFLGARNSFIDSSNRLWISGQGGLGIAQLDGDFTPGTFSFFGKDNGLPHNWSYEIYEERENSFWVGNYHGLVKITFEGNDLANPSIKTYTPDDSRDDALVNSWTFQLNVDKDQALWVGTYHGLSQMTDTTENGTFENYVSVYGDVQQLSNNSIKKVFRDGSGRLWVGTQRGLNLFHKATNSFTQFGSGDGLPSEYILGIAEDREGFLWLATTSGVVKAFYDEASNTLSQLKYYTSRDGLADNITNKNALLIDSQNNIFFGSSKGLSVLSDLETQSEERRFNLALTSFESTSKKTKGFVSIKDKIKDGSIRLAYHENSIRISYAALDFSDPEYNAYRHKFLPTSEAWIQTNGDSELTYYNLSPGTYTLILDGSNNMGTWSSLPIELEIIIKPPFWKSYIAFVLYGLLLLGIVRYVYVMRLRKKVREVEQEARLEKALIEEREQLRKENTADFHDELGSKVTKISLFLTLAERSLKDREDPSQWFSKIRANIKDLSGSFRDLLWVIDPQKDSLSDTFLRLKDFGEDLFSTTQVDFRTAGYHVDRINAMLDPQTKKQVVLIFKEAMNNCLKYANGSRVTLKIEANGKHSNMELIDDGVGFNVQKESKGRGLKNMKDRAKKIGADLSILSSEKGTSVRLSRIPHTSDEYQAKEA